VIESVRYARPPAVRRLDLGDVRLTYLVDGVMEMVTDAFFPAIPTEHWAANPAQLNPAGRAVLGAGALLVESGGQSMLLDLGWGRFAGDTMYGPVRCGDLLDNLARAGLRPEQIDTVAYTHLHVDHVGWTFAERRPVFARARHRVAGIELDAYLSGGVSCAPLSREDFLLPFGGMATGFDDGDEVFASVRTLITPGHSPGHTSYVICAGGQRVVVFGDVFHIPAQIEHPQWRSGPDYDGTAAVAARSILLGELTKPDTLGFAFHFADLPFGRVITDAAGRHTWQPVEDAYAL
jgi:glyoxylase-like metal-dependent hydrolase (beta-lactamase superfamily II)